MKRKASSALLILLSIVILSASSFFTTKKQTTFLPVAVINNACCTLYQNPQDTTHSAVQGACTDGVYAYFAIDKGNTMILKYDTRTWQLTDTITHTTLGHANDMTYNPKLRRLVIANNNPDYDIVTFLDPDTLRITGSRKLRHNIYSIAYNSKTDRYVAGISGGYDFVILDSNFSPISIHKGYNSGYIRQGNDCDSRYIYFAQSGKNHNIIVTYNWSGEHIDTTVINKAQEIENIFHIKNTIYTSFHSNKNTVHKTIITRSAL